MELSHHDPDAEKEWMAEQRKRALGAEDNVLAAVARFVSLEMNPGAYTSLKARDFLKPLLSLKEDDMSRVIDSLQKTYGFATARLALIAYLDPLTRTGQPLDRKRATRMLAIAMSDTPDTDLPQSIMLAIPTTGNK